MFNNEKQLITVLPVHQWRRSAARSRVFTPRGCQASPNTRSILSPGNSNYNHVKSSCSWSGMRCYTVRSQIRRFVLSHTHTPDTGYLPRFYNHHHNQGRQIHNPNGRQPLCCNHQRNSHLVTFHYCCLRPILSQGLKQRINTFELPTVYLSFSGDTALPSGSK